MIAIGIMGLGLLVVAAMFPIAWSKARETADYTSTRASIAAAETSVRMLTRVTAGRLHL